MLPGFYSFLGESIWCPIGALKNAFSNVSLQGQS
jgi:hypothetical protein